MRKLALLAVLALAPLAADGASSPEPPAWTPLVGTAVDPGLVLSPAQAAGLPPTIQDGIGPGSALQMGVDGIQFVCSASFLLRDPSTGTYYLSTAGHCLVRGAAAATPVTGSTHPKDVYNRIDICVDGCISNGLGLGTYVSLKPSEGYHPVAFAVADGVGRDFGLIRIPDELHGLLRPEMPQWGGPTAVAAGGGLGQTIAHYGHGTLLVPGVAAVVTRTPADQGRLGTLATADASAFQAAGHVTGGDSGSGASLAAPSATGVVQGTQALGVITHSIIYVGAPLMSGTMLAYGIAQAHKAGLGLELVPAGDPLPQGPTTTAPAELAFTSPAEGDALGRHEEVVVAGTLSATTGVQPGWRVELTVDERGFDSGLAVAGLERWNATWAADVPDGLHVLRARVVDEGGATLAQANRTVRVVSFASKPTSTAQPTASATPSSAPAAPGPTGSNATDTPGLAGDAPPRQRSPGPGMWLVAVLAGVALRRRF